ncbi:DnaD domain protein [bacterium]|nr:DnaD domain protein [bacterium]
MNENILFRKLLEDDMINFNAILIKNYRRLDINEKDIIVLSSLARDDIRGRSNFNPQRLKEKVGLSNDDLFKSLDSLTLKGYIEIKEAINEKTGKSCEVFSLEKLYQNIVNIYLKEERRKEEKRIFSFEEEISIFYEETYNRQLTPLDMDIIRTWSNEKKFSIEEIKNEMLDAIKRGKTTLKQVDQILVRKRLDREQSPEYKETNKIIEELKNKWKK